MSSSAAPDSQLPLPNSPAVAELLERVDALADLIYELDDAIVAQDLPRLRAIVGRLRIERERMASAAGGRSPAVAAETPATTESGPGLAGP